MKKIHLFIVSLISLLVYELSMIFFGLQGVSLVKLMVTVLVWFSFLIAFVEFLANYSKVKHKIPRIPFFILILLLVWNIISIVRSILFPDDSVTTILGNTTTSLALLVPFVMVFAMRKSSIRYFQKYLVVLLKLGILLFFVFLIATGIYFNEFSRPTLLLLLLPVVFSLTLFPHQTKKTNILITIAAILLFYVSYRANVRTMAIRELMLFGGLTGLFLYRNFNAKWVFYVAFAGLFAPLVLIQQGVNSGESPFEEYLAFSDDDELSTDTRTFLYIELYGDLVNDGKLLVGKGATGKYYSAYFSQVEGDASLRINMEVGALGILIKGGVIGLVLHLIVLYIATFYAFFRSRNTYVMGAGFIVLVHSILLFLENVITYNTYNFLIWFFVGICLSREMRQMNDSQIQAVLRGRRIRR